MIYRRRHGKDTWHFQANCSNWPVKDCVEQDKKPKSGELCNQCRAKAKKAKAMA